MRGDEEQWVVQDQDGSLFLFGASAGAETRAAVQRFEDAGSTYVYRWNLTSVVDTSGNRVEYRRRGPRPGRRT